jgi:hypothetical protein
MLLPMSVEPATTTRILLKKSVLMKTMKLRSMTIVPQFVLLMMMRATAGVNVMVSGLAD